MIRLPAAQPSAAALSILLAAVIVPMTVRPASAELAWETVRILTSAQPGAASVDGVFPVTNRSSETVVFTELQTDCGCLTAEVVPRELEPGASAEVRLRLMIGDREGLQQRGVQVRWEPSASGGAQRLRFDVEIAPWLTIEPNLLIWRADAEETAKRVRLLPERSLRVRRVVPLPPGDGTVRIEPVDGDPLAFDVRVRLTPGSQRRFGFSLETEDGREFSAGGHAVLR